MKIVSISPFGLLLISPRRRREHLDKDVIILSPDPERQNLPEKFRLEDWSELHVMRHLAEMLFLAQPSGHFGIHFLPA
jgi:hypothetical protein